MQRTSRKAPERIAAGHGLRWIKRLQRYHMVSSRTVFWPPERPGIFHLLIRCPTPASIAGSRVSAEIIVKRTASAAATATP